MTSFYVDKNITLKVREELGGAGHIITTTRDLGLDRATDERHLLIAAQNGWTLLSHDRDFEMLHRAWCIWSLAWPTPPLEHAGIIILQQGIPAEETFEAMVRFLGSEPRLTGTLYE